MNHSSFIHLWIDTWAGFISCSVSFCVDFVFATLLKVFTGAILFCGIPVIFKYNIMTTVNRDNLTSSVFFCIPLFIPLVLLIKYYFAGE